MLCAVAQGLIVCVHAIGDRGEPILPFTGPAAHMCAKYRSHSLYSNHQSIPGTHAALQRDLEPRRVLCIPEGCSGTQDIRGRLPEPSIRSLQMAPRAYCRLGCVVITIDEQYCVVIAQRREVTPHCL